MTVGIAVSWIPLKGAPAIVMIADRALTYGNVQGEGGLAKKLRLTNDERWQALIAGSPAIAEEVVWRARDMLPAEPTPRQVRQVLREQYTAVKSELAHDLIVKPHDEKPITDEVVEEMHQRLADFRLNCELIVCGFYRSNPIVLTVSDFASSLPDEEQTSIVDSERIAGFAVIGSGGEFARQRLLWHESPPDDPDPLPAILYRAFDAKAFAEQDIYVSYSFDAWVFTEGAGVRKVSASTINLLDSAFEFANNLPFVKLPGHGTNARTGHKMPKGFEERLERDVRRLVGASSSSSGRERPSSRSRSGGKR